MYGEWILMHSIISSLLVILRCLPLISAQTQSTNLKETLYFWLSASGSKLFHKHEIWQESFLHFPFEDVMEGLLQDNEKRQPEGIFSALQKLNKASSLNHSGSQTWKEAKKQSISPRDRSRHVACQFILLKCEGEMEKGKKKNGIPCDKKCHFYFIV